MEEKIVYFEDLKHENTDITFQLAKDRARARGIKKIVMASTTGATARKALDFFGPDGFKLVIVPHQYGFRDVNRFPLELVDALQEAGHKVHFGTMLFHTENLYENNTPQALANLLRCFSQGFKVLFEIVMMAADGGLLDPGERVIAIAGTARGADTAAVMQAASSRNPKGLRVNEIICKPLNPLNIDELRKRLAEEVKEG